MSIADEITRLQTAKADIKDSIEAKGVTVPSDASIDTYYDYIDQIETGGGGTNYLEQYVNKSLPSAITSAQLGTNIGSNMADNLFFGQNGITSVDLTGTGATKIANLFCKKCSNLSSVTVPSTVTKIGDHFCGEAGIAEFTIPSTVTEIGEYFLGATKITSITVPSTVTSLGDHAFENCDTITTLIFNAPISNPNERLCAGTDNLALVDLNSSVTNIRNFNFSRKWGSSTNLLEVVLRRTDDIVTVSKEIGNTSWSAPFNGRQNIKLYVPNALIASYEANANWAAGITKGYLTIVALEGSQYE